MAAGIYVLRAGAGSRYKIGRSDDLSRRVQMLKAHDSSDIQVVCLFTCKDNILLERSLHNTFESKRVRFKKEWFDFTYDDVIYLLAILYQKSGKKKGRI